MNFCIGDFLFFSTILSTPLSEVLNSTNCFEFGKQYESINLGCMAVYKRKSDQKTGNRTFVFQQDSDCKHTTQTKHEFLTDNCETRWRTDSNHVKHVWKDLKISPRTRFSSNWTEAKRICRESQRNPR